MNLESVDDFVAIMHPDHQKLYRRLADSDDKYIQRVLLALMTRLGILWHPAARLSSSV